MHLLSLAGPLSQVVFILAFSWYIVRIYKGGVRVSVSTFSVLAVTSLSQAIALYVEQEWYPATFMALTTLVNTTIVVLGIRKKNYSFSLFDKLILIAALLGIAAWYVTDNAEWNVYILTAAVVISYFPIFRKTWRNPESEAKGPWVLTLIASTLFLLTIASPQPVSWLVQARQMFFAVGMNIALFRRR